MFVFLYPLINELEYMQLVQKHINTIMFSSILQVQHFHSNIFVRQNLTIYKTCASERHKSGCAHSHPQGGIEGMGLLGTSSYMHSCMETGRRPQLCSRLLAPGPVSEAPLITICLWHSIKEVWTTTDTDLGSFFLMTFFCCVNIFNTYVHYACFSKN